MSVAADPRDASLLAPLPRGLAREMADLGPTARTDMWNTGYVVLTWLVIGVATALAWRLHSPVAYALAAVVISSRQQALLNVEHDALHSALLRSRRANDIVGNLAAAAACGSGFRSTRGHHLRHHRRLNTPDDPDGYMHQGGRLDRRAGLARHLAEGFTGVYVVRLLRMRTTWDVAPEAQRRDKRDVALMQLVLWGTSTLLTAWWVYLVLWLVPLLTLTAGCVIVRNYVDHALAGDELEMFPERRVSVLPNVVEGAILSPFGMHHHAEHHLFPWLPARRLPEARRRLDAMPESPRRLTHRSYVATVVRHLRALP